MAYVPENSDRFCPYPDCGKRMVLDIGQHADTGWVEMWHECIQCGYRERDNQWKRTPVVELVRAAKLPTRSGMTAAERLYQLRNGTFQEVLDD